MINSCKSFEPCTSDNKFATFISRRLVAGIDAQRLQLSFCISAENTDPGSLSIMGHTLKMIPFHIRNPIWTLNRVFVLGKMSGFERESVLYICSHCKTLGHCWSTSAFVNRAVD